MAVNSGLKSLTEQDGFDSKVLNFVGGVLLESKIESLEYFDRVLSWYSQQLLCGKINPDKWDEANTRRILERKCSSFKAASNIRVATTYANPI